MSENKTEKKEMFGFEGFYPKDAGENFMKFWKLSFDTSYENVEKIQDMNQKVWKEMYDQGTKIQADSVKVLNGIMENTKKAQDEYKEVVEAGFKRA
jgi:hypothetical protein